MIRREPQVAGQFYSCSRDKLESDVRGFLKETPKDDAIAIVSPHAGYIYSGDVAGSVFSEARIPENVILIGPNHTGLGAKVSIMTAGEWETPLGRVSINSELAERLVSASTFFTIDSDAHLREHSLEVQLPFITELSPTTSIVPITVMQASFETCEELGKAIATVIKGYDEEVLIVVSSDMNHYESDEVTQKKDKLAIDKVLALDPEGLLSITREKNITMCGAVPTAIALVAARELGATGARLVDYATSAAVSGDSSHVVGYAGMIIE
ncbi:MAG: AmmeMemoRadiSam system protein B [Thermodesulfobacteriota bacterium]